MIAFYCIHKIVELCKTQRPAKANNLQSLLNAQIVRIVYRLLYSCYSVCCRIPAAITYLHKTIKLYNGNRPHMSISNYTTDTNNNATEPIKVKRWWKYYHPVKKQV